MSGLLYRLCGGCFPLGIAARRYCAGQLTPGEESPALLAVTLSNRQFTDGLELSLSSGSSYSFTFANCTFDEAALKHLESAVMEYDVQELNLSFSTLPLASLAGFLETLCQSNLKQLELSGVVLEQEHLSLLERCLPQTTVSRLCIKVFAGCSLDVLNRVCLQANISLAATVVPQHVNPREQVSKKIELVYIGAWNEDEQGGFNSYKHITHREELIHLISVLSNGFYFALIEGRNEEQQPCIDSVVFTVASGKGFIVPFQRDLENFAAKNTQEVLKTLFESRGIKKSCRSYMDAYALLKRYHIVLKRVSFDLTLAVREWNPSARIEKIEKMLRRLLLISKGETVVSLAEGVLSREQWERKYAIESADIEYRMSLQMKRLLAKRGVFAHFKKISLPLEEVLCELKDRGVLVKRSFVKAKLAQSEDILEWAQQSYERLSQNHHTCPVSSQGIKRMQYNVSGLSNLLAAMDLESDRIHAQYVQSSPNLYLKSSPHLTSRLVSANVSQIFLPEGNQKLYSIDFDSLALRILAQLSQDPKLLKLATSKSNQEYLLPAINRALFKRKEFLDKSILICDYATAVCSKRDFEEACIDEAQESLDRFQKIFPKVIDFHHQIESRVKGVRSEFGLKNRSVERNGALGRLKIKILGTVIDYINLFTIKLHRELELNQLQTTIHSIGHNCVLINLEPSEASQVSDLAQKINGSLVKWRVPIPVRVSELVPNEENLLFKEGSSMGGDNVSFFCQAKASDLVWMSTAQKKPHFLFSSILSWVERLKNTFVMRSVFTWQKRARLFWEQISVPPASIQSRSQEELIEEALRSNFSSIQLRPLQRQVIEHVLRHRDTVAVLPTGYGKSICFQLPAMLFPGVTVIISPLISLIENQLFELAQKAIPAAFLKASNKDEILNRKNPCKILYITPETLVCPGLMQSLQRIGVCFFAIDEAHCIHQWGKTFRSSYRELDCIRDFFPHAPILALSATATPGVVEDIRSVLQMREAQLVVGSFFKRNLSIHIKQRLVKEEQLLAFLSRHPGESGVVYCRTMSDVDKVYRFLNANGYPASAYYAKMDSYAKSQVLQEFLNGTCKIVVATVAFGLGINKGNVRFVCHLQMPDSIEKFYQEIGRAGRDGLPAECLMLFGDGDFIQNNALNQSVEELSRSEMGAKIEQMYFFCRHMECRQLSIARYFGDLEEKEPCHVCDVCLGSAECVDGTKILQQIIRLIIDCHESCSIDYLANLLCGINPYGFYPEHRKLPDTGCLAAYDLLSVKSFIGYALGCGYIALRKSAVSGPEFLICSPLSFQILRGQKTVLIQNLKLLKQGTPAK